MNKIQINQAQYDNLLNVGDLRIEGVEIKTGEKCELLCEGKPFVKGICVFYWQSNNNHIATILSEEHYQHFMNQGTVICPRCGGHDVLCEAMVNPNSKNIDHYTDESLNYGWCNTCGSCAILTDTKDVKNDMKGKYQVFIDKNKQEPLWAWCAVVIKDDPLKTTYIKIKLSHDSDDHGDYLWYCNGLNALLSLCEFGIADFIINWCQYFSSEI